jgi:hypothetical protein
VQVQYRGTGEHERERWAGTRRRNRIVGRCRMEEQEYRRDVGRCKTEVHENKRRDVVHSFTLSMLQ